MSRKNTEVSMLDLALFYTAKWSLVILVTAMYVVCFEWNFVFGLFMTIAFGYSFAAVAQLFINGIVYYFSKPLILAQQETLDGINIAVVRSICAESRAAIDDVATAIIRDIKNLDSSQKNSVFIVLSNSREESLLEYSRQRISELQQMYGTNRIFYFHRNPKCDFFSMTGLFQDALLFLKEGRTTPSHYISDSWTMTTKGLRNPAEPLWDCVLGDLQALGIDANVSDVLAGAHVSVVPSKTITIVCRGDASVEWPAGQIHASAAKAVHPDNSDIVFFQPSIEYSQQQESLYATASAYLYDMFAFDRIAKWRLFHYTPSLGYTVIHVERYIQKIISPEVLNPKKIPTGDIQESLFGWTVLLEDVFILRKSYKNKQEELVHSIATVRGCIETAQQFLRKFWAPGRLMHLFALLRASIGHTVFACWLLGTILSWWFFPDISVNSSLLWLILLVTAFIWIAFAPFIVPFAEHTKRPLYEYPPYPRTPFDICLRGTVVFFVLFPMFSLDLYYRIRALCRTVQKRLWHFSTDYPIPVSDQTPVTQSLVAAYRTLLPVASIGAVLLLCILVRIWPAPVVAVTFPYMCAFLCAPAIVYLTAKPLKPKQPAVS